MGWTFLHLALHLGYFFFLISSEPIFSRFCHYLVGKVSLCASISICMCGRFISRYFPTASQWQVKKTSLSLGLNFYVLLAQLWDPSASVSPLCGERWNVGCMYATEGARKTRPLFYFETSHFLKLLSRTTNETLDDTHGQMIFRLESRRPQTAE